MELNMENNPQLRLAWEYVENTGKSLFLTGRAGTGKTTFLRFVRNQSLKRSVVVAPTGVAAINAGGVTIHSFFQLPFGPLLPDEQAMLQRGVESSFLKVNREKINIIRSLDLLIIDEISMVRADLLDAIDMVLRRYRSSSKPFGGLQLLLIGDLQQLPPVIRDDERELLERYFTTFYFFGSLALKQTDMVIIELREVYRQSDPGFIRLLNKVRDNDLSPEILSLINKQYREDVTALQADGYITLTTHNNQARQINEQRISEIQSPVRKYKAIIDGDFPESSFPTEIELTLKKGAQVMFVKNDPSPAKLFYNGKIGKITSLDSDMIFVSCEGDDDDIAVVPLMWENKRFSLNEETKEITEKVAGTFSQFPLKLAWAITIHKSQGLTFDKAIIDARAAFAHGQVYVALSRCRALDGLVLSSRIIPQSVRNDNSIRDFSHTIEKNIFGNQHLNQARFEFQFAQLEDLFNFAPMLYRVRYLLKVVRENESVLVSGVYDKITAIERLMRDELTGIASRFMNEVKNLLALNQQIETNGTLQQRIMKACGYFIPRIAAEIMNPLQDVDLDVDNRAIRKTFQESMQRLLDEIDLKHACMEGCKDGFSVAKYLEIRAKASIVAERGKMLRKREKTETLQNSVAHPELLKMLRSWRDRLSEHTGKPVYMILPLRSMTEISKLLPDTTNALRQIHGMGKRKTEAYGREIIGIVQHYCNTHQIASAPLENIPEKKRTTERADKKKKGASFRESLEMFLSGKTPEQIAVERNLSVTTIESHLATFVKSGEIEATQLVEKSKIEMGLEHLKEFGHGGSLTNLMQATHGQFTFSELRTIVAHFEYLQGKE